MGLLPSYSLPELHTLEYLTSLIHNPNGMETGLMSSSSELEVGSASLTLW